MRHTLFPTLAVAVLAVASAGCSHKANALAAPPAPPNEVAITPAQMTEMKIKVETVAEQEVDDTILTSGKVAYDDQRVIHVFSPVTGKVLKVIARLGDHVKKDDPLVTIDSPDIGITTSDVGKAKADLIAAEHDFRRQKELLELKAASQRDFESAADAYRKAKAEMERASQKARLFSRGNISGQTYTLRSDLEGEVFMKAVSPGMEVAGQYSGNNPIELYTIGESESVWVLADVFELDIPRVKVGSNVVVHVPSWPDRKFEGKVDWISGALDPTTHAMRVRCTFDNGDHALKPEMFATVEISVDVHKATAITRSAVVRLGEQTVVFLDRGPKEDGKQHFERLPLTVDEGEGSKWLTVEHGLNPGDRIVTEGAVLLSGML